MSRKITVYHSSDCPYLDQEQTIKITYAEIPLLGSLTPGYKITSFLVHVVMNIPILRNPALDIVQL